MVTSSGEYRRQRPRRIGGGFTVLELVVVIAVMALLLAVTLPAIVGTRDTSAQSTCSSRLRQLMTASESFFASHRRYPVFYARKSPSGQLPPDFSVLVQLLPYLEQKPLFDRLTPDQFSDMAEPPQSKVNGFALQMELPIFACPADRLPAGGTSYRTNYGTTPGVHATWEPGDPQTLPLDEEALWGGFRAARHSGNIRDGVSSTAFFSERLVGDGDGATYRPERDVLRTGGHNLRPADAVANCTLAAPTLPHASYLGWTWIPQGLAHTAYNHVLTPNSRIPDCFDTWTAAMIGQGAMTARSYHPGGVNVVFGDSAVKFVNETIDLRAWRGLGSNCGGEVVNLP